MKNKLFLLSLQKGIIKELCSKGFLTEEQTELAIKEFEQVYEKNIVEKEVEKKWKEQ